MNPESFQALGDSTRLRIVELLLRGEQPVNDLVERMEIHQSGVSRHLRILHQAGFVQVRPEGQQRYYSLSPDAFQELDDWLARYRKLWEARLDRLGAALEKKKTTRKSKAGKS